MNDEYLSRDDVKGMDDLERTEVVVPEWGGRKVLIRSVSCEEWKRIRQQVRDPEDDDGVALQVTLVIACTISPDGKPLFKPDDGKWLVTKNLRAVLRVGFAILDHSGLTEEGLEDLAKNLRTTPKSGSGSS